MQLDVPHFLALVERAHTLYTWDTEATGLKGDYNSILVLSIKPYTQAPTTIRVKQAGQDRALVKEARERLNEADCWVTYYGKGFDVPLLNTRLLRWGLAPLDAIPHIDMYYMLKSRILTGRRSQAHLLEWLELPEQKMTVGAEVWNKVLRDPKALKTLVNRCESDASGLEALYTRTKHLVRDIRR